MAKVLSQSEQFLAFARSTVNPEVQVSFDTSIGKLSLMDPADLPIFRVSNALCSLNQIDGAISATDPSEDVAKSWQNRRSGLLLVAANNTAVALLDCDGSAPKVAAALGEVLFPKDLGELVKKREEVVTVRDRLDQLAQSYRSDRAQYLYTEALEKHSRFLNWALDRIDIHLIRPGTEQARAEKLLDSIEIVRSKSSGKTTNMNWNADWLPSDEVVSRLVNLEVGNVPPHGKIPAPILQHGPEHFPILYINSPMHSFSVAWVDSFVQRLCADDANVTQDCKDKLSAVWKQNRADFLEVAKGVCSKTESRLHARIVDIAAEGLSDQVQINVDANGIYSSNLFDLEQRISRARAQHKYDIPEELSSHIGGELRRRTRELLFRNIEGEMERIKAEIRHEHGLHYSGPSSAEEQSRGHLGSIALKPDSASATSSAGPQLSLKQSTMQRQELALEDREFDLHGISLEFDGAFDDVLEQASRVYFITPHELGHELLEQRPNLDANLDTLLISTPVASLELTKLISTIDKTALDSAKAMARESHIDGLGGALFGLRNQEEWINGFASAAIAIYNKVYLPLEPKEDFPQALLAIRIQAVAQVMLAMAEKIPNFEETAKSIAISERNLDEISARLDELSAPGVKDALLQTFISSFRAGLAALDSRSAVDDT